MELTFAVDPFDRLVCRVSHQDSARVVTASDSEAAIASFAAMLDDVAAKGLGECFWTEAVGEYRWMLRRVDSKVRVAILWSIGTLTGWENVLWCECDYDAFLQHAREQLTPVHLK